MKSSAIALVVLSLILLSLEGTQPSESGILQAKSCENDEHVKSQNVNKAKEVPASMTNTRQEVVTTSTFLDEHLMQKWPHHRRQQQKADSLPQKLQRYQYYISPHTLIMTSQAMPFQSQSKTSHEYRQEDSSRHRDPAMQSLVAENKNAEDKSVKSWNRNLSVLSTEPSNNKTVHKTDFQPRYESTPNPRNPMKTRPKQRSLDKVDEAFNAYLRVRKSQEAFVTESTMIYPFIAKTQALNYLTSYDSMPLPTRWPIKIMLSDLDQKTSLKEKRMLDNNDDGNVLRSGVMIHSEKNQLPKPQVRSLYPINTGRGGDISKADTQEKNEHALETTPDSADNSSLENEHIDDFQRSTYTYNNNNNNDNNNNNNGETTQSEEQKQKKRNRQLRQQMRKRKNELRKQRKQRTQKVTEMEDSTTSRLPSLHESASTAGSQQTSSESWPKTSTAGSQPSSSVGGPKMQLVLAQKETNELIFENQRGKATNIAFLSPSQEESVDPSAHPFRDIFNKHSSNNANFINQDSHAHNYVGAIQTSNSLHNKRERNTTPETQSDDNNEASRKFRDNDESQDINDNKVTTSPKSDSSHTLNVGPVNDNKSSNCRDKEYWPENCSLETISSLQDNIELNGLDRSSQPRVQDHTNSKPNKLEIITRPENRLPISQNIRHNSGRKTSDIYRSADTFSTPSQKKSVINQTMKARGNTTITNRTPGIFDITTPVQHTSMPPPNVYISQSSSGRQWRDMLKQNERKKDKINRGRSSHGKDGDRRGSLANAFSKLTLTTTNHPDIPAWDSRNGHQEKKNNGPFIDYKSAFDFLSNQKGLSTGSQNEARREANELNRFMAEGMCEIFSKHYVPTRIGGKCE